ncbi:MAG: pseudouridine synthase [Chloroflexota bacterium]
MGKAHMPEMSREPEGERLQKILSRAGVASRRVAEEMIKAGRVTVDGRVVRELGARARPEQDIRVDGRPVRRDGKKVYVIYNKPRGVVSTAVDTHGRPTVVEAVDVAERVYPVGRLDQDSEGLILLTNDGELAHRMTHPRFGLTKVYRVLVEGRPKAADLRRLREGVELDGKLTAPAEVEVLGEEDSNTWLEVAIHEGRKRQVRRMAEAIGHPVLRLRRTGVGPLKLGELPVGKYRHLSPAEVAAVQRAVGLKD